MGSAARRRPEIEPAELDPGVRGLIARLLGQSDHELGRIALLAKQPIEDKSAEETACSKRPEAQAPIDRAAQHSRRPPVASDTHPPQVRGEDRELGRSQRSTYS